MFARDLRRDLARRQFRAERIPITSDSGFHTGISRLAQEVPLANPKDYENYIARLRAIPTYFEQHVAHMREGLATGFTSSQIALAGYESTMQTHVVDAPEKSVFWKPFASFPPGVPAGEQERLRAAGRDAITTAVVPAYRGLLEFFTKEYRPGARKTLGASELPDGQGVLRVAGEGLHDARRHARGGAQDRPGRGRADPREMDAVVKKIGFQGTFPAFLEFLRTDPRFYAKTPDELMRQASWIAKRMDGKLPSLFGKLPRQPYGVEPVPDDLAPKYTARPLRRRPARRPARRDLLGQHLRARDAPVLRARVADAARGGAGSSPADRARQGARRACPPFRRYSYVERLRRGLGPLLRAARDRGRLLPGSLQRLRPPDATRCGAPAGWSSTPASTRWAGRASRRSTTCPSDTALSKHEVTNEIDRYISWPGQALAYKMGELKIRELRARAEKQLGTALRRARVPRRGARERLGAARRARQADRRVHRVAAGYFCSTVTLTILPVKALSPCL